MWEYVFASIVFLMFIGGIYKYFEKIQLYIIEKILPDKRVANMKRKMAELDTILKQSSEKRVVDSIHILDSINRMEKYVGDSFFRVFEQLQFQSLANIFRYNIK